MSTLHVYQGNHGFGRAVTSAKSSAPLPPLKAGQWEYIRFVNVDESDAPIMGTDRASLMQALKKDGYYVWPQSMN